MENNYQVWLESLTKNLKLKISVFKDSLVLHGNSKGLTYILNVATHPADASNRWKKFLNLISACTRVDTRYRLRPYMDIWSNIFDLHNIMVKIFDELPFAVRSSSI